MWLSVEPPTRAETRGNVICLFYTFAHCMLLFVKTNRQLSPRCWLVNSSRADKNMVTSRAEKEVNWIFDLSLSKGEKYKLTSMFNWMFSLLSKCCNQCWFRFIWWSLTNENDHQMEENDSHPYTGSRQHHVPDLEWPIYKDYYVKNHQGRCLQMIFIVFQIHNTFPGRLQLIGWSKLYRDTLCAPYRDGLPPSADDITYHLRPSVSSSCQLTYSQFCSTVSGDRIFIMMSRSCAW